MLFDIDHVPSRKGRFLTLSTMRVPGRDGERALYLRWRQPAAMSVLRLDGCAGRVAGRERSTGRPAPLRTVADQLVARTGEGIVRFVIGDGERCTFAARMPACVSMSKDRATIMSTARPAANTVSWRK